MSQAGNWDGDQAMHLTYKWFQLLLSPFLLNQIRDTREVNSILIKNASPNNTIL